jgi:crotonobetainyl-CoA:carnitine CoA-transferase CaiB-like acyl-CoA transferase
MRMTRMQPRLGEHSAEILRECGYDETSISNLTAAGGACRGQDI